METTAGSLNGNGNGIGIAPHLLFIPMIMQAHFVSAIRLAEKLSARGVKITIVTINKHAESLNRIYTPEGLRKLGINVEAVDDLKVDPKCLEPWSPIHMSKGMEQVCRPLKQRLIAKKKAGLPYPTCMLADRFFTWAKDFSDQLDIPRYAYASYAAVTTRLMQIYYEFEDELRELPDGPDWTQNWYNTFHDKPGLEFLSSESDLPAATLANGWFDFAIEIGRNICTGEGIVINSFSELESAAIEAILNGSHGSMRQKVTRVFPIGPISDLSNFRNDSFVGNVEDAHAECQEWLEKQPTKSVLYVCLGSQVCLDREQIGHLARALEASQQRFLWVLSRGRGNFSTLDDVLPEGFLTRTRRWGKIVTGWVGQLEVLAHPSIFGFVSHCGWQSLLESMTCGVPILGWPQFAEQHFNCRYLQEVLKAGIGITDTNISTVEQRDFENAFRTFMSEKRGRAVAFNAATFGLKAAASVSTGGSSDKAIDELIESFKHPRRETNGAKTMPT
ncbi:hypothetical protein Mapa_012507 [Marchantia paleacea]|nr:hypothetical protein Mapa_012507 [Marchantia paleacea]